MARISIGSILILCCSVSCWAQEESRFTLLMGDIFLGQIVGEEDSRYWIQRGMERDLVPQWWIKSIEPAAPLRSPEEEQQFPFAGDVRVAGQIVNVTSRDPVRPSHLELYPTWSHPYVRAGRYLRGYLVNETDKGFSTVQVHIIMYDENNRRIYEKHTEVFRVFPKTMKPFIVDCNDVKWTRVKRMSFFPTGWSRLPRVDDDTF